MRVNDLLSDLLSVPGGSPQGSILGCYLFCATINSLLTLPDTLRTNGVQVPTEHVPPAPNADPAPLEPTIQDDASRYSSPPDDDDILPFFRWRTNPLDDTASSILPSQTEIDEVFGVPHTWKHVPPTVKGYVDDITVLEKVRLTNAVTHYTQGTATKKVHAEKLQKVFLHTEEVTEEIGMQINPSKTQLLCISAAKNHVPSAYITHKETNITSVSSVKILGFWFGTSPGVGLHVSHMLNKVRSRLWSLRKLKASGLNSRDLLNIYKCSIRPILDYVVPTYHSQLTQEMSNEIEGLQAVAMKIVFGYKVSYQTVIDNDFIETHLERRERIVLKFARKNSAGPFRDAWFPDNVGVDYFFRNRNRYLEEHARTTRLNKSPIFNMRRVLNSE